MAQFSKLIMIGGSSMFVIGLALFYSIELGEIDPALRLVKNMSTFVGLIGIGVVLGGGLLYLINKSEGPLKNMDSQNNQSIK